MQTIWSELENTRSTNAGVPLKRDQLRDRGSNCSREVGEGVPCAAWELTTRMEQDWPIVLAGGQELTLSSG